MKTILKLLVTLAILNAVVRAGSVAWTYYQFRDEVQQSITFGAGSSPAELHSQIMAEAAARDIPVTPDNVTVQREGARTWADVSYSQPVELFPRYFYPAEFRFTVDGFAVAGITNNNGRR